MAMFNPDFDYIKIPASGAPKHRMGLYNDVNHEPFSGDNRRFKTIRVVCHTTGRLGPSSPHSNNHISLLLLIEGDEEPTVDSVRVNMKTPGVDNIGMLEWIRLNYREPTTAISYVDVPTVEFRVSSLYQWIKNGLRHRYLFSPGGSGCHYWNLKLLMDMRDQGWVHTYWVDTVAQFFSVWRATGSTITRPNVPMAIGTFLWTPQRLDRRDQDFLELWDRRVRQQRWHKGPKEIELRWIEGVPSEGQDAFDDLEGAGWQYRAFDEETREYEWEDLEYDIDAVEERWGI